jgi:hypothetical protein
MVTGTAIEKPALSNVNENKAEPGKPPFGNVPILETLPACKFRLFTVFLYQPQIPLCRPRRVVTVFIYKLTQSFVILMVDRNSDLAHFTLNHGMLVDFHIQLTPIVFVDAFVKILANTKERQFALLNSESSKPRYAKPFTGQQTACTVRPENSMISSISHMARN